jgi:hypothetical protein
MSAYIYYCAYYINLKTIIVVKIIIGTVVCVYKDNMVKTYAFHFGGSLSDNMDEYEQYHIVNTPFFENFKV